VSSSLRGLLVDWYGVLTDGIDDAMASWCAADGIDYEAFRRAMEEWFGEVGYLEATYNPVHALERGEMEVPDFEQRLAERLVRTDGGRVAPAGLLARMFDRFGHAPDMAGLVRRLRDGGVRTALLSNSWGDHYLRDGWEAMFDTVVVSGEVGMRKPEARIFDHALKQLALPPEACVFVDDHPVNVRAAAELGIVAVHHRDYETTRAELEVLFARPLG
jgi:epoxide hydrolase-like predicted phosphatase